MFESEKKMRGLDPSPLSQQDAGIDVHPDLRHAFLQAQTRRHFLRTLGSGLGTVFMGTLAAKYAISDTAAAPPNAHAELDFTRDPSTPLSVLPPQFAAKARRVIYLHMAGAPSQLELFEHKPELKRLDGQDCPASFLAGKRFAFISGVPKLLGSQYPFHQAGQSGQWISDRLPHIEKQVDDICFIKSMRTDQFNHAPAQLLVQTGNPRLGYPSFGSWVVYGLGTENQNLPGFIVLLSGGKNPDGGKQLWSSGFLPSVYQGVQCRSHGEPVLYLDNPQGVSRSLRRSMLDTIDDINQQTYAAFGNPETVTRIAQYEMAFRMQMDATDAKEALNLGFNDRCREVDQPTAALLKDLKSRGLLEDTLVIWGGEFGRTPYSEGAKGRDHHSLGFSMWLAGGGVKGGYVHGATDELGMQAIANRMHVHDLHATILHLMGLDHERLTYRYSGRDFRLTDVHGHVVREIIA